MRHGMCISPAGKHQYGSLIYRMAIRVELSVWCDDTHTHIIHDARMGESISSVMCYSVQVHVCSSEYLLRWVSYSVAAYYQCTLNRPQ